MYGTLDAAEQWSLHYTATLEAAGFRKGAASPCHFWHRDRDIWPIVHGDDFISIAEGPDQQFLHDVLADVYEVKVGGWSRFAMGETIEGSREDCDVFRRCLALLPSQSLDPEIIT